MILKSEIKRFIFNPILLIVLLISVCCQLRGAYLIFEPYIYESSQIKQEVMDDYDKIEIQSDMTKELNSYEAWFSSFTPYIGVVAIVSTLPFATTYIRDKKSGYIKNILTRTKKSHYFISKVCLNAISGGIVVSLSSIITLIILKYNLTNELPSILSGFYYDKSTVFIKYLFEAPIVYIGFVFCLMFIVGVTYSTMALSIGVITENIIFTILIPQIYMLVCGSIFSTLGLYEINPWNIMYFSLSTKDLKWGLINTIAILIISLVFIYIKYREESI